MPELCKIDGCERRKHSRGWCKLHYERNRKYGTTELPPKPIRSTTCELDGCGRLRYQAHSMCGSHYMKWYRYGDPYYIARPILGQGLTRAQARRRGKRRSPRINERFGTLVVIESAGSKWRCQCDCGADKEFAAGGLNRTGDASTCGDKTAHRNDKPNYPAAHARLRADRGPAKNHPCVACGEQAAHWSYNHDDPEEMYYDDPWSNSILAYSAQQDSYSPRCVPCHKRFDLDKINSNGSTLRAA